MSPRVEPLAGPQDPKLAVAVETSGLTMTENGRTPGRSSWLRRKPAAEPTPARSSPAVPAAAAKFDLAPNDPIIGYLQSSVGAVDITTLSFDSPALAAMREAGVVLVVPLVSSGELIGLLSLGPRLSEGGYSTDDRHLLATLAGYAAPAMRVGQLVNQQAVVARDRERIEQELKVAQLIQQQFLPKQLPDLPGWEVAAFYQPARTVGGDFYDFIELPDGRMMLVVGDVTDKGVPAALVMASTHALLRSSAPRLISPGQVLARINDLLCVDIPAHMFVTCLALVLEPLTGHIEYANAGHDLPYIRTADGVVELRATGMPLGLMVGMEYEVKAREMAPGDCILLHSDGLAEAHNSSREMFGFPRVSELAGRGPSGEELIDLCLTELSAFTGADHEQEDDITLVTLQRLPGSAQVAGRP
ncbi:MAG TPA: PP2C family protein-serine/threonine phosphatase [Candidatus Dormibacteraeota bacterium]|nr:PP2C family protein-serine/threonine phosphatase [Candidatus Dormibacteraeota bacterium]